VDGSRILKVALPTHLVDRVDAAVDRLDGYPDRATLIRDAVENLLAELEAGPEHPAAPDVRSSAPATAHHFDLEQTSRPTYARAAAAPLAEAMASSLPEVLRLSRPDRPRSTPPIPSTPAPAARIQAPDPDLPTAPAGPIPTEVTWGMHNRDWPTLWAASRLGQEVAEAGRRAAEGVEFGPWVDRVSLDATNLEASLSRLDEFDTSGLPVFNRRGKGDLVTNRFRNFFLGPAAGDGPLFGLGLAAPVDPGVFAREPKLRRRDARILPTAAGVELLTALDGLEPLRTPVRDDQRAAYLAHLARWVPCDFDLLETVVHFVEQGIDHRLELVDAVVAELGFPPRAETGKMRTWSETVVAGIIARGREWNVMERHQVERRYRNVPDAGAVLAQARAAAGR